jgi:hypothetical protein
MVVVNSRYAGKKRLLMSIDLGLERAVFDLLGGAGEDGQVIALGKQLILPKYRLLTRIAHRFRYRMIAFSHEKIVALGSVRALDVRREATKPSSAALPGPP